MGADDRNREEVGRRLASGRCVAAYYQTAASLSRIHL